MKSIIRRLLVPPRLIFLIGASFLGLPFTSAQTFAGTTSFFAGVTDRGPDTPFSTAIGPVIADFDNDGKLDVATADAEGASIFISYGNADGAAKSSATFDGPSLPDFMAGADLNGDQLPDLIFAVGGAVTYYLNDANTPFQTPVDLDSPDVYVTSVATADFNGDGFPDIVASGNGDDGSGGTIGKVEIYLSTADGNGQFTGYAAPVVFAAGSDAGRVAVGDLNGDGFPDVAVANTSAADTGGAVTVLFGDPNAIISSTDLLINPQTISLDTHHPVGIAIGDLTRDGNADIVTTSYNTTPVSGSTQVLSFVDLVRNLGDSPTQPTFKAGENFYFDYAFTDDTPGSDVKLADIDGDGNLDAVVVDSFDVRLHVLRFSPVLDSNNDYQSSNEDGDDTTALNLGPHLLAIADLDGDGNSDVVVAHAEEGGVTRLLNATVATPSGGASKAIEFASTGYFGDGDPMFLWVNRGPDSTGTVTVKFAVTGTAIPSNGTSAHSDFDLDDPAPDNGIITSQHNTATLTFGPGVFQKLITLSISTDAKLGKAIVFTLQTPTGDAVLGTNKTSTFTISNGPPSVHPANALVITPSGTVPIPTTDKLGGIKIAGRTPGAWTFATTQTLDSAIVGLGLKVQYSLGSPGNWVDLPGGVMSLVGGKGTKWTASSSLVPVSSKIYFRTLTTAPNLISGQGPASAACKVVASPQIQLTITAKPDSDPTYNQQTHASEGITYHIAYKNTSTVTATNVVIAAQIPPSTSSQNGSGSTGIQLLPANSGSNALGVYWNLGTVHSGDTGEIFFTVTVDPHILDKNPKTPPLVGFSDSTKPAFKALSDFSKKAAKPVYGALFDDPFGTKPLTSGGLGVVTRVLPALAVSIVADKNIAGTGDSITYTVTINNYAGFAFQGAKFTDQVPYFTALDSVNTDDGTGNFIGATIAHPTPGTNPSVPVFQFGSQQTITWTLGTIPANAVRTIKFTVRTLYDMQTFWTDSAGVSHTAEVDDLSYNLTATPPTGGIVSTYSASVTTKPVRTLISAADPAALPQIGFVKEVRGEGKGLGELFEPGNGDIETVLPGDSLDYTLHYFNTGGSTARGCVIQEEVADGATFTGFIKLNGNDPSPGQYLFRDKKGVVLPYSGHTLAQDLTLTRLLEFHLGDLAAGGAGTLSYRVAASVKAGAYITSNGYRIWSESLNQEVPGKPSQVAAKAVLPISFQTGVTRDKPDPVKAGDTLTYTVTFTNNGGFTASNVTVASVIPTGTKFVSGSFPDSRVTGTFDPPTTKNKNTVTFTIPSLHASDESTSAIDPNHPDTGKVAIVVKVNNPLDPTLTSPGATFEVKAAVNGSYPSGALVHAFDGHYLPQTRETRDADNPGGTLKPALVGIDSIFTRVQNGPTGPNLWAFKQYPQFATQGQKLLYKIVFGNSGTQKITGVRVGIQVPFNTTLDTQNTTGGYVPSKGGILTWFTGDLLPGTANGVCLVVNIDPKATYANDVLEENSCYVASDTVTDKNPTSALSVVPGPARTTILSTAPVVAAWQAFGTFLQSIGANLFGKGSDAIAGGVHQFSAGSVNTTERGADLIALTNGALVIQNGGGNIVAAGGGNIVAAGGGNIVAAGGGNIVAAGGGNIVAAGGGNIVAAGGGNIVAAGGGNVISVQGIGFCNQANLLKTINGIVAAGGGNIVAAGGGNLIRIDGNIASLVGLDGNPLLDSNQDAIRINAQGPGIVAAGGGNIVAAGGGNIVAAGGGNFGSAGTASLLATKPGFAAFVNPAGAGVVSAAANVSPNSADIISHDGGGIISHDGGGLINQDGNGLAPVSQQ